MPFKHNATCRHYVGKMKYEVTDWQEYQAGLRRGGSLTMWLTSEAIAMWIAPRRTRRGGRPRYSNLAIETAFAEPAVRLAPASDGRLAWMGVAIDGSGCSRPRSHDVEPSRRMNPWRSKCCSAQFSGFGPLENSSPTWSSFERRPAASPRRSLSVAHLISRQSVSVGMGQVRSS